LPQIAPCGFTACRISAFVFVRVCFFINKKKPSESLLRLCGILYFKLVDFDPFKNSSDASTISDHRLQPPQEIRHFPAFPQKKYTKKQGMPLVLCILPEKLSVRSLNGGQAQ
jgi:hypothetical protein